MANITIEVRYNSADSKADLYDNNNKIVTNVTIKKNTDMLISVGSGFTGTATISKFSLYGLMSDGSKDPNNHLGTWLRTDPSTEPSDYINISATSNGGVQVTDTDTHDQDGNFFFSVIVTDANGDHDSDPALKVKKTTG